MIKMPKTAFLRRPRQWHLTGWRKYAIAGGFILLWLIAALAIYRDSQQIAADTQQKIRNEMWLEAQTMAEKLAGVLERTYITIKTISLLPAVRGAPTHNRRHINEDVVTLGQFSEGDANTIQQLYNHIASDVAVSEVYLVYNGFAPERGEVPFLMYDQVLLARIAQAQKADGSHAADVPEEYEVAEYAEYVRQLSDLQQQHPRLPDTAPDGIAALTSSLLRTCDNSQYTSIANGDERNSHGLLLSVPIYDQLSNKFKGLVTAVLRANTLEAILNDWPRLPITEADKILLAKQQINLNTLPSEYLLANEQTGVRIMDRRNLLLPEFLSGQQQAAIHLEQTVQLPFSQAWQLHRYKSAADLDAAIAPIYQGMWQRLVLVSLLIATLALAVNRVLRVQHKASLKLAQMANYDTLTGLPNRRLVAKHLADSLARQPSQSQQYAVLMIDLDNFKQINDTLGHQMGDNLLIEVARRFVNSLRDSDELLHLHNPTALSNQLGALLNDNESMVGRLGGDEFLVLLPNLNDRQQALTVAHRLHASLKQPIALGADTIYIHASIGIAIYPEHGNTSSLLLRSADTAMYLAKHQGRGQTVVYQPDFDDKSRERLQLLTDLHTALLEQQFVLHYQPELNLATGHIDAVEALLRWQHPTLGLVYPGDFIPLLEQSGMIIEAGQWVLETACRQLKDWQDQGSPIKHMCVNVSIKQLAQAGYAKKLRNSVQQAGINPADLCLELTESMLMQQPEVNIKLLHAIRKTGVKIALDDFGTGFSSLSYLRQLPLDVLKIDRSFVIDIHSKEGLAICEALNALATRLGLKVIAEGIETAKQFSAIHAVGCDWMQGYLIARPLAAQQANHFAQNFDWAQFKADHHLLDAHTDPHSDMAVTGNGFNPPNSP
jgi:predicted signal transduction protein with EAL and GGDEF domain